MESPTSPNPPSAAVPPRPPRIVSVDALRGFDMFWIIGGEKVAEALDRLNAGPVVSAIANQCKHVDWEGFHFYDAIFPLFLFLIGVSTVLSMDRLVASVGRKVALGRVLRRTFLLFAIGVFYYGGLARDWPDVALSGVLPRIALCYGIAASLYLFLSRRGIVIAIIVSLVGYGLMLAFIPFPDVRLKHEVVSKNATQAEAETPGKLLAGVTETVHGTYEEGYNLTHYVDFRWLPGKKRNLYYTNEGLLSTIPSVATTLFGILAGWLITSTRLSDRKKVAGLFLGGTAGVIAGLLLGLEVPIIKRIWTSSFCLLSSGFSAVMLGIFYLIVDVWRKQRWCVPFLWIGSNALAVYLAANLIDFNAVAARFVGGDVKRVFDSYGATGVGGLLLAIVALLIPILLAHFLYRQKIFIRL